MKLLDQIRQVLRLRHYSYRTEQSYVAWIERYVRLHKGPEGWRHPRDLGAADVEPRARPPWASWPNNIASAIADGASAARPG